jgi:hypothetical protein
MRNTSLENHPAALRLARPADPACAIIEQQVPALILSRWESERWVLPWSLLLSAKWERPTEGEYLRLTFSSQIAVVHGKNLEPLLSAIASFKLGMLQELPESYEAQLPLKEPFISKIEIREIGRRLEAENSTLNFTSI